MPKLKPSNAVLPARYVCTNTQHVLESDEETLSAMESDGTLTADDSEKDIDSDSTVVNDGVRKKRRYCIFKIKDETPDSDEDNASKQKGLSTLDMVIKQEPLTDHEDNNKNGTDKINLYPNSKTMFSSNENESNISSSEKVFNSVDQQYLASNVKIKEEMDSCVTDTSDLQAAVTGSQESVVGNELVNNVYKNFFGEENSESNNSKLISNNLQFPSIDVDKQLIDELSPKDAADKSEKMNYILNSALKVKTENQNSNEANSSGYESESCAENMKTPLLPSNSAFEIINNSANQTLQSSPGHSNLSISNYNSVNQESENSCNRNEMKNLTVNSLNTVANENENCAYLYSEVNNIVTSFSTDSVFSVQSHSEMADCSEITSRDSTLYVHEKTTVNNCVSPKGKASSISKNGSPATNNVASVTASQKNKTCLKEATLTFPSTVQPTSANSRVNSDSTRELIEYSKIYLNFSKNDIEKCLEFVNRKVMSKPHVHPIFLGSEKIKVKKSEKGNVFPAASKEIEVRSVSDEIVNMPSVKDLSSPLFSSENTQGATATATAEENSQVNDRLKICDQSKCEVPFTEKNDDNNVSARISKAEVILASNEKTVKSKICDRNIYAEVPPSEKDGDNQHSNIDSKCVPVLSNVPSSEAVMTNKEKSNVNFDNARKMYSEIQSSQNDDDSKDNFIRFNRIMAEIALEASKMNACSESTSCKTPCHAQSSIETTPTITPTMQNEVIPLIKQEKIDSMTSTKSLTFDIEDTSVQPDPNIFSEESNVLDSISNSIVPSVEDLQKIIETSSLLNTLSSSEKKLNPLVDVKIKIEPPEIEEIILDGDLPLSSNVNITQPTCDSTPITTDDDIRMLIIKKKQNSKKPLPKKKKVLQRNLSNYSSFNLNTLEVGAKKITNVPNNNFDAVSVLRKFDTFQIAAQMHGMKSKNFSTQQSIDNTVESIPNILKNIVVEINTGDDSTRVDPNDSSKGNEKKICGTSSSLSKRTVYVLDQPHTDLKYFTQENKNTQNEPPVKKIKNTLMAHQENPTSSFTYNETNNCCHACKRKVIYPIEKTKKIKSEEEEHIKISFPNSDDEKNLGQTSTSFDRMPNSTVLPRKHTLTYSTISIPSKANKINTSLSDRNFNNENVAFSNAAYSTKACASENICLKPSKSFNGVSSDDVNIKAALPIDNNHVKPQTNPSDRNSSNMIFGSTNATYSAFKNKNPNPSKFENETVSSVANTRQINCNAEKHEANHAPLLGIERRGKGRILSSKCLHKSVGKILMDIYDLSSLILEWNANWLYVQRETKKCASICDATHIKDSYENELDYYNTHFPLHLLSIWLKISDSWKMCPPCIDSVFENQVEKPSFIKIGLSSILNTTDMHNWPKREDIVLCSTIKSNGREDNLFGRICNVTTNDYNPPANRIVKDKCSTLKKVKFELFCAELFDVPTLANVKVQILSNIRIALLQNDALQNLNSSMKDIILNPKRYISRWKFISCCSDGNLSLEKSMKSILESVTSDAVKITVVDAPTPADCIFDIVTQLTTDLIKKRPVLIGLKTEESFLKLAKRMESFNPILAIKKRELNLPEELGRFTLEERSEISRDIFKDCHVTLTLLSSIFLGDFTSVFSNQNLTCILHEAHLCTETETALLLYYDVKNLVLLGSQEAQTGMHPLLKHYGYDISLFNRFCKAISMYTS